MPGMGGMNHGSAETTLPATSGGPNSVESSALLGGDAGDVSYPYYLINGRIASATDNFFGRSRSAWCVFASSTRVRIPLFESPLPIT